MSNGRWDQHGFDDNTDGGNYPEGFVPRSRSLAPHDRPSEPLYPLGVTGSHPRTSSPESGNVNLLPQWRTPAPNASGSWTTTDPFPGAVSIYPQAQFDGRRAGCGSIGLSEPQTFGHAPSPSISYHSIPTSETSAQPLYIMEHNEAPTPRIIDIYDATSPPTSTGSTSSDSGSWNHASSPLSSTGDSVESIASPATTLHMQKEIVAPENVVYASQMRRKKEAKYQCTGYGTCTATFTAGHNLRNHINSHLDNKPFGCEFCDARAVTKPVITRHQKKCKARPNGTTPGSSRAQ